MAKVFYFSDNASSFRMAQKISQKLPHCEMIKITSSTTYGLIDDDVVGIVFPLYYDGLPDIVEIFLLNLQVTDTTHKFIAITRGVLLAGGVKKGLVNKLQSSVSYYEHITMGESFDIDLWKYASLKDKTRKNKQLDVKANKIVKSLANRALQRQYTLKDFWRFIIGPFQRNNISKENDDTCNSLFFVKKKAYNSRQTSIV